MLVMAIEVSLWCKTALCCVRLHIVSASLRLRQAALVTGRLASVQAREVAEQEVAQAGSRDATKEIGKKEKSETAAFGAIKNLSKKLEESSWDSGTLDDRSALGDTLPSTAHSKQGRTIGQIAEGTLFHRKRKEGRLLALAVYYDGRQAVMQRVGS